LLLLEGHQSPLDRHRMTKLAATMRPPLIWRISPACGVFG
jgi:hypothetical protein